MKHASKHTLAWLTTSLALYAGTASAQSTQWTNTLIGSWFIPTNWTLGVPAANGSSLTNYLNSGAFISTGGIVVVDSAGANASFVDMRGPSIDPARASTMFVLGTGRLAVSSLFELGNSTVNIQNGGQVSVLGSTPYGFATELANGHITVTGPGSYFQTGALNGGSAGSSLSILNGGRVDSNGVQAGGVTTVSGLGSAWTLDSGAFFNTFTVSAGATVSGHDFHLDDGTTTVTGSGSVLRATTALNRFGSLDLGYDRAATLNIANGGVVRSDSGVIGHQLYSGGTPTGVVNITDVNSAWLNAGLLAIGGDQATTPHSGSGTINVSSGGLLSTATSSLGNGPSSFGKVTVDGIASRWLNTGDVVVGNQSVAVVEVTNGATMRSANGIIGSAAGSNGSVSVTGLFSSWIASGSLFIGNGGLGQINLGDHGVVTTAGNAYLGFGAGSQGVANVSGTGSTWTVNGPTLAVGGSLVAAGGSGSLEIGDNGTVNAREVMLYRTGSISLLGNAHLNGHVTSDGGLIGSINVNALDNDITLQSGGLVVRTGQPTSILTFNGAIDGSGGLIKNTTFLSNATGTLVLTGANTYVGATIVDAGRLVVDGSGTSATTVDHGTLAGNGTIAAAVRVGDGLGTADAVLSPGSGIGRLTTGDLSFRSDSVFDFQLDSDAGTADSVMVDGSVDIGNGATFVFGDLGSTLLAFGTSFVAIDNDGLDAIAGRFSNLADGAVFDAGLNWFRANYSGGSGNDLVFTTFNAGTTPPPPATVSEPSTVALVFAGLGWLASRRRPDERARRSRSILLAS